MHPYGNSFAKTVLGAGMKLSKEHSSKSKRSLHHLKSLHIKTPNIKQSLPRMHHYQGWEQFFFKNKIMDSVVQSATSPDPLVRLKGTEQSSRRKCWPQPGHVNGLKSTPLDSGWLWKQITSHLFHSSLQPTCPRCPPRILRFRLRMMQYNSEVLHVPGKCQISADALSRAPVTSPNTSDIQFIEQVEAFAGSTMDQLPDTAQHLQEIIEAQRNDEVCTQVRGYCQKGWPAYMPHEPLLRPYWESRAHFAVVDDLLFYDERIVIPQVLRLDMHPSWAPWH